jgi:hypothetical protein
VQLPKPKKGTVIKKATPNEDYHSDLSQSINDQCPKQTSLYAAVRITPMLVWLGLQTGDATERVLLLVLV